MIQKDEDMTTTIANMANITKVVLFTALGALLCVAAPAYGQGHAHDNRSHDNHGHAHDHDDHGHAHGDHDHGHHRHAEQGVTLNVESVSAVAIGQPLTINLKLNAPGGAIAESDLALGHDNTIRVMVVDEGLEQYTHARPEVSENGVFTVAFTPEFPRVYKIWANFQLAEDSPHFGMVTGGHRDHNASHGHTDDHGDHSHSHGDGHADEHGHRDRDHRAHDDRAAHYAVSWVTVGEEAAPAIAPREMLQAETNGLRFTLSKDAYFKAGEPQDLRISVTDAYGAPIDGLEPLMGVQPHLVAFNRGATEMTQTQPSSAKREDESDRNGPNLDFTLVFDQAGVHRLFFRTKHDGREITAPFTVVVRP